MNAREPIVLASASPRRRELLAAAGLTFEVGPVDIDEPLEHIDSVKDALHSGAQLLTRTDLSPRAAQQLMALLRLLTGAAEWTAVESIGALTKRDTIGSLQPVLLVRGVDESLEVVEAVARALRGALRPR